MKLVIGVDLGGTNVRAGLFRGKVLIKLASSKVNKKNSISVVDSIYEVIEKVWDDDVTSVGVGVPGTYKDGKIINSPNLPHDIDVKKELETRLKRPVVMENDANCFTIAHAHVYDVPVLLGVTLGTGLGSGLLINGSPYHGALYAPELSMVPWKSKLISTKITEDVISISGLLKIARRNGIKVKTPKELFELAKKSAKAKRVFALFGKELGEILATVHVLFDPNVIVIGGQIRKAWRYFAPAMKKSLSANSRFRVCKIVCSTLKEPGVVGAALLVR
jgi:glucokinase